MANIKNNQGAIFLNDKAGNPKRPDLTGSFHLSDEKWFISVWKKISSNCKEYFSVSVNHPQKEKTDSHDVNRGAIFFNTKEDKDCELSGRVNIDGTIYFMKANKAYSKNKDIHFYTFILEEYKGSIQPQAEDYDQDQSKNNPEDFNQAIPFDHDDEKHTDNDPSENPLNIFDFGNS